MRRGLWGTASTICHCWVAHKTRNLNRHTFPAAFFYGVVSSQTERVVEFFLERGAAEAMIGEVREDEPMLAGELRVEAVGVRL